MIPGAKQSNWHLYNNRQLWSIGWHSHLINGQSWLNSPTCFIDVCFFLCIFKLLGKSILLKFVTKKFNNLWVLYYKILQKRRTREQKEKNTLRCWLKKIPTVDLTFSFFLNNAFLAFCLNFNLIENLTATRTKNREATLASWQNTHFETYLGKNLMPSLAKIRTHCSRTWSFYALCNPSNI